VQASSAAATITLAMRTRDGLIVVDIPNSVTNLCHSGVKGRYQFGRKRGVAGDSITIATMEIQ
jgi:hypothetical protein